MSMTEEVPAHLQGNGRPTQEELTLTDLKVVGELFLGRTSVALQVGGDFFGHRHGDLRS